jgi:hypothetical protein
MAANFFNSAAVAVLMAGFITPLLSQDVQGWVLAVAVLAGAALHATALCIVRNVED